MMKFYPKLLAADEWRVNAILQSEEWESDPVSLYDRLVSEIGPTRAGSIWNEACNRMGER